MCWIAIAIPNQTVANTEKLDWEIASHAFDLSAANCCIAACSVSRLTFDNMDDRAARGVE